MSFYIVDLSLYMYYTLSHIIVWHVHTVVPICDLRWVLPLLLESGEQTYVRNLTSPFRAFVHSRDCSFPSSCI